MLDQTGRLILRTALLLVSQTTLNYTEPPQHHADYVIHRQEVGGYVCYGDLGCFSNEYPWTNNQTRTYASLPVTPEELQTMFCLYTRENPTDCQLLDYTDANTFYNSQLIPIHKTYFTTHGYLENAEMSWVKVLTKILLEYEDCNVIVIDWVAGSGPPYPQSVANVRLAGAITAHFIAALYELMGVNTENCHIIGHSLGAHLAGYAGEILRNKFDLQLGRITGLDPAVPLFSSTHPQIRLDPTDASFVDVIHTDARQEFLQEGVGMAEPLGHLDFYPNGGNNQPGCDHDFMENIDLASGSFMDGLRMFYGCDHFRSFEYFMESIRGDCQVTAIECDSYQDFLEGKCFTCQDEVTEGNVCVQMGLSSVEFLQREEEAPRVLNRTMVKLFTLTSDTKPFCSKSLYRVRVSISNSTASQEHGGEVGQFSLVIDGVKGRTEEIPLRRKNYFQAGNNHTEVVGGTQVGRVRSVELTWKHSFSLNILSWRLGTPYLHVNKVIVDNLDQGSSATLCLHMKSTIISGTMEKLRPCEDSIISDFV